MNGMTLKQHAKHRFLQLCDRYRKLKETGLQTQEQKNEFIALSLEIHAAKGEVPKRYWKYANKQICFPVQCRVATARSLPSNPHKVKIFRYIDWCIWTFYLVEVNFAMTITANYYTFSNFI